MNKTQTMIDARALKIGGIFSPPVCSVDKVYTQMASCQYASQVDPLTKHFATI